MNIDTGRLISEFLFKIASVLIKEFITLSFIIFVFINYILKV